MAPRPRSARAAFKSPPPHTYQAPPRRVSTHTTASLSRCDRGGLESSPQANLGFHLNPAMVLPIVLPPSRLPDHCQALLPAFSALSRLHLQTPPEPSFSKPFLSTRLFLHVTNACPLHSLQNEKVNRDSRFWRFLSPKSGSFPWYMRLPRPESGSGSVEAHHRLSGRASRGLWGRRTCMGRAQVRPVQAYVSRPLRAKGTPPHYLKPVASLTSQTGTIKSQPAYTPNL